MLAKEAELIFDEDFDISSDVNKTLLPEEGADISSIVDDDEDVM